MDVDMEQRSGGMQRTDDSEHSLSSDDESPELTPDVIQVCTLGCIL